MSDRRFLYCIDCNAVHHVTPFDTAPIFVSDDLQIREFPQDDRRNFIDRHFGHRINELMSVAEDRYVSGDFVDPMKEAYIEVTDGEVSFVLRSFRRSIADPLTYEVIPRQLTFWYDIGATLRKTKRTREKEQHRPGSKRKSQGKGPKASNLFMIV
jgi:hypothetical protein